MLTPQAVPRIVADLPRIPAEEMLDGTAGRILAAGVLLFARHGYHGTTIRQIGEVLDLKPPNLYAHFRSKEHLLAEVVRIGHEEHHRKLRGALIESGPEPTAQIRALVRAHVRVHTEYAMLATVANNEMHALSPEMVASVLSLRAASEAMLDDVIRRGAAMGVFDPMNSWITGAAIGGMGMRVAGWYRPDCGVTPEQIADVHAELAVRMLQARPSE